MEIPFRIVIEDPLWQLAICIFLLFMAIMPIAKNDKSVNICTYLIGAFFSPIIIYLSLISLLNLGTVLDFNPSIIFTATAFFIITVVRVWVSKTLGLDFI